MTDHRVTDLSYGHLGKASYDTEGNQWTFSNTNDQNQRIQQLLTLTERISPSIQNAPKKNGTPSQTAKSQSRWLMKSRPETFPGYTITSVLAKAHDAVRTEHSRSGSLLTVGRAVDADRISRSRRPRILCKPCGGAGHVLQLIKPDIERRGWGRYSAAELTLLELESSERGYWAGTGGAIRQIESADDENESGAWLAVRQDTIITIFRPLYGRLHHFSSHPTGFRPINSSSRLNPNPVATLTTERMTTEDYMDVSFNPWYARQFAVVDARGYWSIWDLERQDGKGSPEKLIPGKKGNLNDGHNQDIVPRPAPIDHADGWYRILWACNINTIVVCNRRYIAVIDITSALVRLLSIEVLTGNSTEWTIELKRSPEHLNYLFILTTSRIFWVEAFSPGEDGGDQIAFSGIKVKLSYRHFRDPNDQTLTLTLVNNDPVTLFISSARDRLVNYYSFMANSDSSGLCTSFRSSFTLSSDSDGPESVYKTLQALCVLPAPLTSTSTSNPGGQELQYLEQDVRFFQLWALTSDFGLHSTLFSVPTPRSEEITGPPLHITAPTIKLTKSLRSQGPQFVHSSFIMVDGTNDERFLTHDNAFEGSEVHFNTGRDEDDLRFRLNWKVIFQQAFGLTKVQIDNVENDDDDDDTVSQEEGETRLKECLDRVSSHIQEGISQERLLSGTLHEISGISSPSGEIERASSVLRDFLHTLRHVQSPEKPSMYEFMLSDLTPGPTMQFPLDQASSSLDPLLIYHQLIDMWMTNLPPGVSGKARLSKFNIIRQTAVELFLSSFAVSLRSNAADANIVPIRDDDDLAVLEQDKDYEKTRESSPANFSSQVVSISGRQPYFSLPTPAQTPSLYSRAASATELKEDPAISRLRQYAVSIKSRPDFGKSTILSQWPSALGSDPAHYSWEARQKVADEDQGGEGTEKRRRKEEARRHKRTEKFLNQERDRAAEVLSQPMVVIPSGSQPIVAHNDFSSQTVEDIPMTQPDRGTFGSRSIQKSKKKSQKHRTAGFR